MTICNIMSNENMKYKQQKLSILYTFRICLHLYVYLYIY
jgi:hypothetical protein